MRQIKAASPWPWDNTYARLPDSFFARQLPEPVAEPQLVVFNEGLAAQLGLPWQALAAEDLAAVLAGNALLEGMEPLAQAYGGHQFGQFAILGDGRALLLGELTTPASGRVDIQLKGSGPTPFSRGGDGRAALGPMLREYLLSEAMAALGIPTTRSLAVATTGQQVYRPQPLPGAVLTRIAASHLRVGTFQYFAARQDWASLRQLTDYAIRRHYPQALTQEQPELALVGAVVRSQAQLVAQWMLVGFIHGVMNTDNISIAGETLDYGPCAFLDEFHPETVFSSIDQGGRYR